MKINTNIHLSQSQTLTMTPQMQQSIQVLQLSTIELNSYLQQFLLENPFLEQESQEEKLPDIPLTQIDESDRFQMDWSEMRVSKHQVINGDLSLEERLKQGTNLHWHLKEQLYHKTTNVLLREIGLYLIDLVDDEGYLRTNLEVISQEMSHPLELLEECLSILQGFDPVGVSARNLGECLKIQLKDLGLLTHDLSRILDNLDHLSDKGPETFATELNIEPIELREALTLFGTLNPKPGLAITVQDPIHYIIPDVIFRRNRSGHWVSELNDSALPRIIIDRDSYLSVSDKNLTPQTRQYINTQISDANWLLKSLRQRSLTILAVSQAILKYQETFLNKGKAYLKPPILKDLAQELGVHESTISRAVTGKYASTPYGTIELSKFLSTKIKGTPHQQNTPNNTSEISNKVVQLKIKELIDLENKNKPLSDDQLVYELKKEGLAIARRTVTKYREILNIPSSYERKKLCRLLTF